MTLTELKNEYKTGELSILEVTRRMHKCKDELVELYPQDIPINGKIYLFLNDKELSEGYCEKSNKSKSFRSVGKGFRTYCGNQFSCECNKNTAATRWEIMDQVEIDRRTVKRRKTVQKLYGVDSVSQLQTSKDKAEKTCMDRYGTKSPTQNSDVLRKSSNTCMHNHGVAWPSQSPIVYEKITEVFLEKYGVARPSQLEIFRDKAAQTCIEKYGVDHPYKNASIYQKGNKSRKENSIETLLLSRTDLTPMFSTEEYAVCKSSDELPWNCNKCGTTFSSPFRETTNESCPTCYPKNKSWGEQLMEDWLVAVGIPFEVGKFNIIPPLQLDFYIPKLSLAIEFNGIYWHSETAGREKMYHYNKFKKCEEKGIKLIQVFEQDLFFKEDLVKSRIMNALGKTSNTLYARKLQVKQVSNQIAKEFFNKNHLQGSLSASLNYALYDQNNVIVSLMSISKSRFSKNTEWELTRFASLIDHIIVGGASKLFAAFINEQNPKSVVSYADLKWGKGNLYEKLGFSYSHTSKPNYWYFKGLDDIHSRIKFQKHKLPKDLHHLGSEWDIMKHLGWNRFWDCGNVVYIWRTT